MHRMVIPRVAGQTEEMTMRKQGQLVLEYAA